MIRTCTAADANAIAEIYNHYILHTNVTFEEEPVDAAEMARRMQTVRAASLPWLVAEDAGNSRVAINDRVGVKFDGSGAHLFDDQNRGHHAVLDGSAL